MENHSTLWIPFRDQSQGIIEIPANEIPDAQTLIDIFLDEEVPLKFWVKFAATLYKQGRTEDFVTILERANQPDLAGINQDKGDRIAVSNGLAAYYAKMAIKSQENQEEKPWLEKATASYNKALTIDPKEYITWVGMGMFRFTSSKDPQTAQHNFKTVIEGNPNHIPALFGRATVLFSEKEYDAAIKTFIKIIEINHTSQTARARFGIGLCNLAKGNIKKAKLCFERALELEESNVEALVALSILKMNEGADEEQKKKNLSKALQLLTKAFQIDPNYPMVLNQLANHFFYKKEYEKVRKFAEKAFKTTSNQEIKAESCYHIARAKHAQGQFGEAKDGYYNCLIMNPKFVIPQYGLGQLYLLEKDYTRAASSFNKVLVVYPENFETLKGLGFAYYKIGKIVEAESVFKQCTELKKNDPDSWLWFGITSDNSKPEQALLAYERSKVLREKLNLEIKDELLNNIGALKQKTGDFSGAMESYKEILGQDIIETEDFENLKIEKENITVLYNLARLFEEINEEEKAIGLYKCITKECPTYVDCYLRLGCMAKDKGKRLDAETNFKEVFENDPYNSNAWCLLGNLNLAKSEWGPGQKRFERVLEKDSHDAYSLLALGNIYALSNTQKEKEERYLKIAMNFYYKVLSANSTNLFAANGLGVVFAEKGKLNEAKECFHQVREATADLADVAINLANINMSQGQVLNAIKLYEKCLENNPDPQWLLYLAKAYFEVKRLEECKSVLGKILHMTPNNMAVWYNLALCHQDSAMMCFKKKSNQTTVVVRNAVKELTEAERLFKWLSLQEQKDARNYSVTKANKHYQYCSNSLGQAEQFLEKANQFEQAQKKQKEEQEIMKQKFEQKKLEAEQKQKEIEEQRRKLEEEALIESRERLEAVQKNWEKEVQNRANKAKSTNIQEKSISDDEEEVALTPKKNKKRKRSSKKGKDDGDSDSENISDTELQKNYKEADEEEDWKTLRDKRNPLALKLMAAKQDREFQEKHRSRIPFEDQTQEEKEQDDALEKAENMKPNKEENDNNSEDKDEDDERPRKKRKKNEHKKHKKSHKKHKKSHKKSHKKRHIEDEEGSNNDEKEHGHKHKRRKHNKHSDNESEESVDELAALAEEEAEYNEKKKLEDQDENEGKKEESQDIVEDKVENNEDKEDEKEEIVEQESNQTTEDNEEKDKLQDLMEEETEKQDPLANLMGEEPQNNEKQGEIGEEPNTEENEEKDKLQDLMEEEPEKQDPLANLMEEEPQNNNETEKDPLANLMEEEDVEMKNT